MIVSLFIILVLCFIDIKLPAAAILLIIRYWASWSDRLFIMEDVEDELNLILSTKILSIAVLESFRILVAKFTVCIKLYVVSNEFFFWLFSLR
jgi:hypothetical protein